MAAGVPRQRVSSFPSSGRRCAPPLPASASVLSPGDQNAGRRWPGTERRVWLGLAAVELRVRRDLACRLSVFRMVSIQELQSLAEQMEVCTLAKGSTVVSQGDEPYYVYFVIEGEVELIRHIGGDASDGVRHFDGEAHPTGPPRETLHARLGLCTRGDVFGDLAAMDQTLQPYTARCTKPTTYLACPWSLMLAILDGYTLRGFKSCVPPPSLGSAIVVRLLTAVRCDSDGLWRGLRRAGSGSTIPRTASYARCTATRLRFHTRSANGPSTSSQATCAPGSILSSSRRRFLARFSTSRCVPPPSVLLRVAAVAVWLLELSSEATASDDMEAFEHSASLRSGLSL